MPEKVIGGGSLVPAAAEVEVPSWKEFDQTKSFVWQETQKIWRAIDQLTGNPNQKAASEYDKEIRKVFEDIRNLERNVWRKEPGEDRYTLWDCIRALENHVWRGGAGHTPLLAYADDLRSRLEQLDSRINNLPDSLRETVREAVRAEREPLLGPAAANIGAILEDNRKLREEIASLRAEVENLKATSTP